MRACVDVGVSVGSCVRARARVCVCVSVCVWTVLYIPAVEYTVNTGSIWNRHYWTITPIYSLTCELNRNTTHWRWHQINTNPRRISNILGLDLKIGRIIEIHVRMHISIYTFNRRSKSRKRIIRFAMLAWYWPWLLPRNRQLMLRLPACDFICLYLAWAGLHVSTGQVTRSRVPYRYTYRLSWYTQ